MSYSSSHHIDSVARKSMLNDQASYDEIMENVNDWNEFLM